MRKGEPIWIWRRSAKADWLRLNDARLQELTDGNFVVIERPGHKRLTVEICCERRAAADELVRALGGESEKLSRDWFEEFFRLKAARPIRVGARLMVTDAAPKCRGHPSRLIIPAGLAFGTGEHATTAMSLRLLEEVTRRMPRGWRMLDAGTGAGILALAGKRFGAGEVVAIDDDPVAIATAKKNARANRIQGVKFAVAEVNQMFPGKFDVITANLYYELLAALLPRFRRSLAPDGFLILSGVLRAQEPELVRGLQASRFRIQATRRRGKWIALLAAPLPAPAPTPTPDLALLLLLILILLHPDGFLRDQE